MKTCRLMKTVLGIVSTALALSILSVSASQERAILLVGAGIGAALLVMGRPLLFASLDPDVAAVRGVPVRFLGLAFMVLLAVTVAAAVQAVGALLVFALLLLPATAFPTRLTYCCSDSFLTGLPKRCNPSRARLSPIVLSVL